MNKQRRNLIIREEVRRKELRHQELAAVEIENAILKASEDEYSSSAVAWMTVAIVAHCKIIPHLASQQRRDREAIQHLVDRLEVWHSKLVEAAGFIHTGQIFGGIKRAMGATAEMLSAPIAVDAHKDDWLVPHIFRDLGMDIDEMERGRMPARFSFKRDQHAWPREELVYRAWAGRAAQALITGGMKNSPAFAKVAATVAWIGRDKRLSVLLDGSLSWSQVRLIYRQLEKDADDDPIARFARSIRPPPGVQAETEWLLAQLASREGEAFLLCFD